MTQQQKTKLPDYNKPQFSWDYVAKLDLAIYNKLPRQIQEQLAKWMIENSGKRKER